MVDKVEKSPGHEQLVSSPVDELKDPNKGVLSTKIVKPVNAGLTDEPVCAQVLMLSSLSWRTIRCTRARIGQVLEI